MTEFRSVNNCKGENRVGHYIFVLWFLLSIYLLSSLFPRLCSPSQIGCLPYFHTWCGLSANLECMSEMCCTRVAGNNTGHTSYSKNRHLHTIAQLSSYIFATKARVGNRKNVLNTNISSTCPHNMVNFGPLEAEICWRVWGTPANFSGFRILTSLLHGTLVVGVSQTLGVEQRAPPVFGRAAITLGIGPHF